MKHFAAYLFVFLLILITCTDGMAAEEPKGVTSLEAYRMVVANPDGTFIVDVRTTAEYEFVGHPDLPNGVPNIPIKFYPTWEVNRDFVRKVKERYKKDDTIITMCRSGPRALQAARLLMEAGFSNVYYMTDSFEGEKDPNGHRTVNGWKVNGLPYTYSLDEDLVYKEHPCMRK